MSELNLSGLDFTNANLSGVNLSGTDLSGANLSGINLRNVENLDKATFDEKTNLDNAKISKEHVKKILKEGGFGRERGDLHKLDLSKLKFKRHELFVATKCNVNLSNANLMGVTLNFLDLSDANLSGADLTNATLKNIRLKNANLKEAVLKNVTFKTSDGYESYMLYGNFLSGANLSGADLSGADLSELFGIANDLIKTNLTDTNLKVAKINKRTFLKIIKQRIKKNSKNFLAVRRRIKKIKEKINEELGNNGHTLTIDGNNSFVAKLLEKRDIKNVKSIKNLLR